MTQANVPNIGIEATLASNGIPSALPTGLTVTDLAEACRQMILVRTMDERIWMMNRQAKFLLPLLRKVMRLFSWVRCWRRKRTATVSFSRITVTWRSRWRLG